MRWDCKLSNSYTLDGAAACQACSTAHKHTLTRSIHKEKSKMHAYELL